MTQLQSKEAVGAAISHNVHLMRPTSINTTRDDGRTETSSSCDGNFESKSQDYEDLVTPRVDNFK